MNSMLLALVVIVALAALLAVFVRNGHQSAVNSGEATREPSRKAARPVASERMVQDIRMTKTSRVVDQVDILDQLSKTQHGYRQYCELTGTSMRQGGVTAPYSQRQVAYYDVRCYRIESANGRDVETLVAQERSIDPFYFTDGSCDTPVYVDLSSFGDDAILVQSMNHIEGPNSDFSRAFDAKARSSSGGPGVVTACSTGARSRARALATGISAARSRAASAIRAALAAPVPARQTLAPACAGGACPPAQARAQRPSRERFEEGRPHPQAGVAAFSGPGGPGGHGRPDGPGFGGPGPGGPGFGGPGGMPPGLGDFLGGLGDDALRYLDRPRRRDDSDSELGSMLLGAGLGALLASLSQPTPTNATVGQPQGGSFRGYRLVEDVVPLASPVYCIGEIYRNGTVVYMGRSVAPEYPTSFFATRPEAEVITNLSARQ